MVQVMVDGYENFVVCVGMQMFNQYFVLIYWVNFISCNCMLVEWFYCLFWFIGEVVDVIFDDMICKGICIIFEIDVKDCGIFEVQLDQL